MTISFRVKDTSGSRLEKLSELTQRTKSFYLNEALERYLDEVEDYYLAINTLEEIKTNKQNVLSFEEIKKRYEDK